MLEAINLSKKYGRHQALTDLNLSVAPGEVFCLLGANGAGKTTTINLFMSFIQTTTRHVEVNDQNWEYPKTYLLDRFYPNNPQCSDGDTTEKL